MIILFFKLRCYEYYYFYFFLEYTSETSSNVSQIWINGGRGRVIKYQEELKGHIMRFKLAMTYELTITYICTKTYRKMDLHTQKGQLRPIAAEMFGIISKLF